ncbi:MAG: alpha/beta hydrolase [Oscillibacter sp.]|nr:alpha/beta hydrolase [Oscillibacter sp.]
MLSIMGIVFSLLIAALVVTLLRNVKEQERQQALMAKTDDQRIGKRFYLPRDNLEDVTVNLYLIEDGKTHPLVINLHGGAFIAGDADTLDTQSDRISKAWRVNVATVNYKLAKNGYDIPYGTKEVADTVKYFIAHADERRIDPERIFILGYSAGAYHAMASVLALKKEGIDVAGQIICYGFLKDANDTYLSFDKAARKTTAPALFILADNDPISDGSLKYRQSLADNGVSAQVKKYDGAMHGFIEENNPEYDVLKAVSKSPEQEAMARDAENCIGQWISSVMQ